MLLWFFFGFVFTQPTNTAMGSVNIPPWGGHLFLWIILALLGWGTFGFPIHG